MTITTQSRLIRLGLVLFFILQSMFFILAWTGDFSAFFDIKMRFTPEGLSYLELQQLTGSQKLLGAAIGCPSLLIMSYGLWHLWFMLKDLETANIFSLNNIRALRSFTGATLLGICYNLLEAPLRTLVLRMFTDGSDRPIKFSINTEVFMLLFISCLFYLLINMMHEGRRLAEENEGFI